MLSAVLKIVLVLVLTTAVIFVAGVSGVLFRLWPTALQDRALVITSDTVAALERLRTEQKFGPNELHFYPGAPNEATRVAAQAIVDGVIGQLVTSLPSNPRRALVLATIKTSLPALEPFDSEERDEALSYFDRVLSITGVESSGELLNVWRYGFPYGWVVRT